MFSNAVKLNKRVNEFVGTLEIQHESTTNTLYFGVDTHHHHHNMPSVLLLTISSLHSAFCIICLFVHACQWWKGIKRTKRIEMSAPCEECCRASQSKMQKKKKNATHHNIRLPFPYFLYHSLTQVPVTSPLYNNTMCTHLEV